MFEDYYGDPYRDFNFLDYLLIGGGPDYVSVTDPEAAPPTEQPITAEPVAAEPVYSPPTLLPTVAEPVPAEPVYTLPTPQPVQPEPSVPEVDLGGWNPSMISTAPLNILSDPGPAYDPNMLFRFDTGNQIGVPNGQGGWTYQNAAPLVFQPGQQYVMTDESGKNVIARASTPEEMQKLVQLSQDRNNWALYQADASGNYTPGTQLFSRTNAGSLGSMLLPMAGIAGLALGLSALGAGAGGGAAAGSTGAGAGAGAAGAGGAAAGGAAAGGGLASLAPALGEIVVLGTPSAGLGLGGTAALLGGAGALGGLSSTLGGFQPSGTNYGDQLTQQPEQPLPDEIVVQGAPPQPPLTGALAGAGTVAPILSVSTPTAPQMPVEQPLPEEIVVEAPQVTPPSLPPLTDIASIGSILGPTLVTPPEVTVPKTEMPQDNFLRDIMRYYTLGSGILDALGVGQGGGAGTAMPYTPTFGAVPTFGRGQFQPFTGDYETYATGPEWNFFNQPAQPQMLANSPFPFLLPPSTPSA